MQRKAEGWGGTVKEGWGGQGLKLEGWGGTSAEGYLITGDGGSAG